MILIYIIASVLIGGLVAITTRVWLVKGLLSMFYLLQGLFAVWIIAGHINETSTMGFFTFDAIGVLCFSLMAIISPVVFAHSTNYLDSESLRELKYYDILLMMLCVAICGVYFANNLAVTWVFLEATTLCTAGLIYHRRNERSLEATWKYIFVCSTGIAIAYLGILLLSTVAIDGDLSYVNLRANIADGNTIYLKLAFLFILIGYSCKMEIFPLYTIGIDANYAAPAPTSALLSTALVNAGFVSVYRVYKVMEGSQIFPWVSNVLIVTGVLSLIVGALYLRRTNHYKRFLAYSTVENMGIVTIGLGVGGVGVFAALLHLTAHSLIKSGMFLQIAQVGKCYGGYRINRIANYMRVDRLGAVTMIVGAVALLAFPPSLLFVSELMVIKQMILNGQWWLVVVMLLGVCVVIYSVFSRVLALCYRDSDNVPQRAKGSRIFSVTALALIVTALVLGVYQPEFLVNIISQIIG